MGTGSDTEFLNDKAREFRRCEVVTDFEEFTKQSDLVVANRYDERLASLKEKVFTRDIYKRD